MKDEVTSSTTCGECGTPLPESSNLSVETDPPCPTCGSMTRAILVTFNETLVVHDKLAMKGKRAGIKEPYIESVSGDDLHRKTGKWMKLNRVIDRENDLYKEEVIDPDNGIVVHRCEEPLSAHKGHGSAKIKKKTWPN